MMLGDNNQPSTTIKTFTRLRLGSDAGKEILTARACPDGHSPKRPTPMEVDLATPNKRCKGAKRKNKGALRGEKLIPPSTSNQPLLTDMWKMGKNEDVKKADE